MSEDEKTSELEQDLCVYIFTASAAMVGVCLTVISLFHLSEKLRSMSSIGDNLLAIDAMAFLISCIFSYVALRTRKPSRRRLFGQVADYIFLAALSLIAVVCTFVAYEFI